MNTKKERPAVLTGSGPARRPLPEEWLDRVERMERADRQRQAGQIPAQTSWADFYAAAALKSDVLDAREVAEILRCHVVTVRAMARAGQIPFIPIGTGLRMRFSRAAIMKWIRETATGRACPAGPDPDNDGTARASGTAGTTGTTGTSGTNNGNEQ